MSQQPTAPWPFNITDPVRAVHFALDKGNCLFPDPLSCPTEATARAAVQAYDTWTAARRETAEAAEQTAPEQP